MNIILGWLSVLESSTPIAEVHSALAVIVRNAQMQAKLIEDLLDMTRLMSGNMQLNISPVDVADLLKTTIQGVQPAADAKGIQLTSAIESTVRYVLADSRRLQQVLWNLVHNAIKFTPNQGRVEVRVQFVEGELLQISVGRHWSRHVARLSSTCVRTVPTARLVIQHVRRLGSDWASRSRGSWSSCMAGRLGRRAQAMARGRRSSCGCRQCPAAVRVEVQPAVATILSRSP